MALTNKLSAIGDAIREKTGKSELLTLDEMPEEIRSIEGSGGGGESGDNEDILRAIIDGSYTGVFSDNQITEVKEYTFVNSQISGLDTPNLKIVGTAAFRGIKTITNYYLPNLITVLGNAFDFDNTVDAALDIAKSFDFPKLKEASPYCFRYRSSVENFNLPEVEIIGDYCFRGCSGVKEMVFPKLTTIGDNAFRGCIQLEKLDILGGNQIEAGALRECSNLQAFIIRSTNNITQLTSSGIFSSSSILSGTGYIYVPAALLEEYKAATNWVSVAGQIRAIEDYPDICG